MWLDKLAQALFGKSEPAERIGPASHTGASILADQHPQVAKAFGVQSLELTDMWKHEIRLDRTMGRLAAGVDALARPGADTQRDRWLVTEPNGTAVLGVVGRYQQPGRAPTWVATDTQGQRVWQATTRGEATMQRGGWPSV